MRLNHFTLVFVMIAIAVIVITDIRTNSLKAVIENKEQIDRNLDTAIDDGVSKLAQIDLNNNIIIDKEAAVNSFFMSLSSSFAILSDKESQEKLNLCIPVIVITMEDGFYVFFSDEYTGSDGYTYVAKRWSENYPFDYEDEDFIYRFTLGDVVKLYDKNNLFGGGAGQVYSLDYHDIQNEATYSDFRALRPSSFLLEDEAFGLARKGTIIARLEEAMAYYTNRHNIIAEQYGITYSFSLPAIKKGDWEPYLDNVSMLVVFQGYPYGNETGEFYNRFASAGAKISKRKTYYIEQKEWYLIYHRDGCPELSRSGIVFWDEPYYDPLECVKQGCYQCPVCFQSGIYAPNFEP